MSSLVIGKFYVFLSNYLLNCFSENNTINCVMASQMVPLAIYFVYNIVLT